MTLSRFAQHVLAGCSLALSPVLLSPFCHAQQAPSYHVVQTYPLGGDGGWDYLQGDPSAHRLYLTHNASVDVFDTALHKKVGAITGLQGTHGLAFVPGSDLGYISDGRANAVVAFHPFTLEKIASIPAGTNPDGIAFEPATSTVWAFNGRSKSVTVIDTKQNTVVATIDLPGKPEFPVADGNGLIYDNIEDENEIAVLDAKAKKLVAIIPLPGCDSPSGLAFDAAGSRLFSVCDNKVLAVTSTKTRKVIATAPIGEGPDAVRFDAKRGLVFASDGRSGDLTVVDLRGAEPHVIETVTTAPGARTEELDPETGHVYVVSARFEPSTAPQSRPTAVPGSFFLIEVAP